MRIGLAGAGKMGSAMARRLMSSGQQVTVWNRTAARAQGLLDEGAAWASTPAELAATCDIVLTMLIDDAALDEVYLGAAGLLSGPAAGRLFITRGIDAATIRNLLSAVAAASPASSLASTPGR